MRRRWQVNPDETGTVTRDAMIGAFIDAAVLLDLAGGTLSVVVGRAPTDLPGEMVTTGAVFEWRDRTDAAAQPEVPRTVTTQPAPELEPEPEVAALAERRSESDENPDGFDYSKLEAEDIEEPVR